MGLLVIFELFLTASVTAASYGFPHYKRGTYLNPRTHFLGRFLSLLLLPCIIANCILIALRLVVAPEDLGNKD